MPNFSNSTGPLDIQLVNDYLFRALLQKNNKVLKALIASLLHMNRDEIQSVHIENEIVLGEQIQDKEFILDILVCMNDNTMINLEMQVVNLRNWVERSISYLCRTFDSLTHGADYNCVRPAIQIGLLDYTLFPESPEFYASYSLMNIKTHQQYSDKLRLSVLDLTRIDLATDEDKAYGIDHWASLFKSHTWEELKMLAQNDDVMTDAVSTIYDITQDSILKQQIRTREEWIAVERRFIEEKEAAEAKSAQIEEEMARSRLEWDAAERRLIEEKEAAEAKSAQIEMEMARSRLEWDAAERRFIEEKEAAEAKSAQIEEEMARSRLEWDATERRFIEEKEAAEAKSAQIEEEMARSRLEWDAAERRLTDEKAAAEAKSAELAEAIDAAHVTIDSQQQQIAELQELVQQLQSQS